MKKNKLKKSYLPLKSWLQEWIANASESKTKSWIQEWIANASKVQK